MPTPVALRPTTRRVLAFILALGDGDDDLTMPQLVRRLSLGARTVRRAFRELEGAGYVTCDRTSSHHKRVMVATREPDKPAFQSGPKRPKAAQSGPKRPKKQPENGPSFNQPTKLNSGCCENAGARPLLSPQQHRLGLSGFCNDADRHAAARAIKRVNVEVGKVWRRRGRTFGFLSLSDASVEGMVNAKANYPWDELVAVVLWSAERAADGLMTGAYFGTTFKGDAFNDRHRQWQAHLERTAWTARQAALEPAPVAPAGPVLDGERIGELAQRWLRSQAQAVEGEAR